MSTNVTLPTRYPLKLGQKVCEKYGLPLCIVVPPAFWFYIANRNGDTQVPEYEIVTKKKLILKNGMEIDLPVQETVQVNRHVSRVEKNIAAGALTILTWAIMMIFSEPQR